MTELERNGHGVARHSGHIGAAAHGAQCVASGEFQKQARDREIGALLHARNVPAMSSIPIAGSSRLSGGKLDTARFLGHRPEMAMLSH